MLAECLKVFKSRSVRFPICKIFLFSHDSPVHVMSRFLLIMIDNSTSLLSVASCVCAFTPKLPAHKKRRLMASDQILRYHDLKLRNHKITSHRFIAPKREANASAADVVYRVRKKHGCYHTDICQYVGREMIFQLWCHFHDDQRKVTSVRMHAHT